jgi:hypothetical protein
LNEQQSVASKGNPSSAGSKSGTSSHKRTSTLRSEHTDTDKTSMHSHARETHDPEALEASIQELVLKKKSAKSKLRDVTEQQQVMSLTYMTVYCPSLSVVTGLRLLRTCVTAILI